MFLFSFFLFLNIFIDYAITVVPFGYYLSENVRLLMKINREKDEDKNKKNELFLVSLSFEMK